MDPQSAPSNVVHVSYDPGFIVLSYFVSLIGCVTTLTLLHRRTSTRGLYNWFLLAASCITMGGSGIWAMHFIANRAIVLNHGDPDHQISYSPAFTALSFFLPILVLLIAFYFLASADTAKPLFIILAGILTGTAVCGMHYLGDYGIANYTCTYQIGNVVGAAIIAVTASLIALSIFFRLRETWADAWWKRALCAALLASAVAGMHWTAAVGTRYRFKGTASGSRDATRVQTVIVCAVLSVSPCILLMAIVLLRGRKLRLTKTRAQQVVLACAYFDQSGRIMLTREGALPCEKITNRFVERTFGEDELSRSHPTFTWVFKASRNWAAMKEMLPGMVENISSDSTARKYAPGYVTPATDDGASEVGGSFSSIFKQLFCVAAQHLANSIHEPIEQLGVLFEEPLETGAVHLTKVIPQTHKLSVSSRQTDVEKLDAASMNNFGRGKYLLLSRRLGKSDVDKFAAMGYRFGSIPQVSELLAGTMEVPHDLMKSRLERVKLFATLEHLPPSGVYIACFMLRPSVHKSFDVLVPIKTQNQLPMTAMQLETLNEWQMALLSRFDERSVKDILKTLINESACPEWEREFRWQLHSAIIRLLEVVGDFDNLMGAKFSARQIHTPCRSTTGIAGPTSSTLVTMRLMNTIHSKPQNDDMTYVPLSFFSTQQQVDSAHPNHEAFVRRMKLEFGYRAPQVTEPGIPRTSMRSSRRTSLNEQQSYRTRDADQSNPSSVFRFKNALRSPTVRKSEESSIVRVRDVSVGASEDKSGDEVEDLDIIADLPLSTAGTPNQRNEDFDHDHNQSDPGRPREGNYQHSYLLSSPSGIGEYHKPGAGAGDESIELVAISAEESGGWVSELFALFGLGQASGQR